MAHPCGVKTAGSPSTAAAMRPSRPALAVCADTISGLNSRRVRMISSSASRSSTGAIGQARRRMVKHGIPREANSLENLPVPPASTAAACPWARKAPARSRTCT